MNKALLVIDLQNDYFSNGKFPLIAMEDTLERTNRVIEWAKKQNILVIFIRHLGNSNSPFFVPGSAGSEIHPQIYFDSKTDILVDKRQADSFYETKLEIILKKNSINELFLAGSMTQNCITHTALSPNAINYQIKIIEDCCTSVTPAIHQIALRALSIRFPLITCQNLIAESMPTHL